MKTRRLIFLIAGLFFVVFLSVFSTSKLSPESLPSSTFHSLSDIYNLITNNSTSTPSNAISTSSSPTATTSHSINEIYALLANLIKQEDIKTGTTILGITGNYGTLDPNYATVTPTYSSLFPNEAPGVQGYTLENIYNLIVNNATTTSGSHSFAITPAASMYTTTEIYDALINLSANLSSSTIRNGVSYLGTTGIYNLGGNCTADSDCPAGYCGWDSNQVTQLCTNGETGVDYCTVGPNCASGICSLATNLCVSGEPGTSCTLDSECVSEYCSSGNICEDPLITSRLVGYWNFDTDAGTEEPGLIFDGVDDHINTGVVGQNSVDEDLEIFLQFSTKETGRLVLLGNYNGTAAGTISLELNSQAGKLRFYLADSNGLIGDLLTTQTYNDGVVYDVHYLYNGSTKTMSVVTGKETVSLTKAFSGTFGKLDSNSLLVGTDRRSANFYDQFFYRNLYIKQNSVFVRNFTPTSAGCLADSVNNTEHCNSGVGSLAYGNKPLSANDLSVSNNDGVYNGDTHISDVSSILGNSMVLDGNGDYASTSQRITKTSGKLSMSTWVNFSSLNCGGVSSCYVLGEDNGSSRNFSFYLLNGNALRFFIFQQDNTVKITDYAWVPELNRWYHLVAVANGSNISTYIDGNMVGMPVSYNGTIRDMSEEFLIGAKGSNQYYFNGLIDEVGVWNRALSQEEISGLYNGGIGSIIIQ